MLYCDRGLAEQRKPPFAGLFLPIALYDIYCAICHGETGNGKGTLVERGKFAGVPSYGDKNRVITQGGIYHVIYYGFNAMGSYASQINEEERWQVALYVEKLRDDLVK